MQLNASEVASGISEALLLTFEGVALVGAGHLLLRPVPQPRDLHRHLGDADGGPVPAAFLPCRPGEGLGRRAGQPETHGAKTRRRVDGTNCGKSAESTHGRKLSQDVKAEPNLTPILDMVFQLITFFMLVINFKSAELDLSLKLPVVGSARPVETTASAGLLVLNIDKHGQSASSTARRARTSTATSPSEAQARGWPAASTSADLEAGGSCPRPS